MNFKHLAILFIGLILTLNFTEVPSSQKKLSAEIVLLPSPKMCAVPEGRCTGSAYCTACTNCSRCGYCNSGGSCGVCGKRPSTYSKKKKTRNHSIKSKNNNVKSKSTPFLSTDLLKEDTYFITTRTSLRASPNAAAKVLKRLAINESVQIFDSASNKYWCKVLHQDRIGWVKKHLLKKRNIKNIP